MKILITTLEYPPQIGGIASYVVNLAKHLPPADVVVWAPKIQGDKEVDSKMPWKTYRGKPYSMFFWPRWFRWYREVKAICKKEKINLLFVQHALPGGYIGYLIKKFLKIPYCVFLHGSDVEIGLRKKIRKFAIVMRQANKVIVNSNFLKNKIESRLGKIPNLIVVNPAPGDHFLSQPDPARVNLLKSQIAIQGKKVIISVGRFDEGKGFPHLIRVMRGVIENVPNAVLLLVGDGPKKQELVSLIQKHELQNNIRFLGKIDNDALPEYFYASDLFVLLSHRDEKTEEGWGTVYLEAAAASLPVVAGVVGGVEEAVEHLKTGILVDARQEIQVINVITELLKQHDYARQMGVAGKNRVINNFTWEKQIKLILS